MRRFTIALLAALFFTMSCLNAGPAVVSASAAENSAQSAAKKADKNADKNADNNAPDAKEEAEAAAKAKAESEAKAAEEAKKAEAERAAEAAKSVQQAWDALLATHNAQLAGIIEHTQTLKDGLSDLSSDTSQSISLLEQEFQKLDALSQATGSMPSDLTVLVERFHRIKERTQALILPLQNTQAELEKEKQALTLLDKSLSGQGTEVSGKLSSRLKEANKNISNLQTRYDRIIDPALELITQVQTRIDEVMKNMPTLWNNYYFQSSGHFYDVVAWGRDIRNLGSLEELFSMRLTTELPSSMDAFFSMLTRIATSLLFCLLFGLALRHTARRRLPEQMQAGVDRVMRNSAIWIAVGLSIHLSAWDDGKLYQIVATLGTMCLCWGQMLLAWDLYEFENPNRSRLSPLWPMFPPLLIGMVLLNFDPFPLFICVAWVIVQAVDLWKTRSLPLPPQPLPEASRHPAFRARTAADRTRWLQPAGHLPHCRAPAPFLLRQRQSTAPFRPACRSPPAQPGPAFWFPSTVPPLQRPMRTAYRRCAARVHQTRAAAFPSPHLPRRGQSSPLQSPAQSPDQRASAPRIERPSRLQIPLPPPPACGLPGAALPAVPMPPNARPAALLLPDPSALS